MTPKQAPLVHIIILILLIAAITGIAFMHSLNNGDASSTANNTSPNSGSGKDLENYGCSSANHSVKASIDYRVLHPDSVIEPALESNNVSAPDIRRLQSLLEEGWVIIEVNVTIKNMGLTPLVIEAGGPYCYWPFGRVYAPVDFNASLADIRGESEWVPHYCQLALVYVDLLPGKSHISTYYFAVTPEYEGLFSVEAKLCFRQHLSGIGDCCTYTVEARIVVSHGSIGG